MIPSSHRSSNSSSGLVQIDWKNLIGSHSTWDVEKLETHLSRGHPKLSRRLLFGHLKMFENLQMLGHFTILQNKHDSLDVDHSIKIKNLRCL